MAAGVGLGVVNTATTASAVVWVTPDYGSVAASVRYLCGFIGLDAANPLGRWIRPGMTVAVKPYWVKHQFVDMEGRNLLFTHASLVRVLIDAALQALAGNGHIYVTDAPLQGCDFARFRRQGGLAELEKDYADAPVASDHGGLRETVPETAGARFRTGDAADLATDLEALLASPDLLGALGAGARESAARYDWPRIVQRCQEVYATL